MFKKRKIKLGFVATTVLVATAVLFILLLAFVSIGALQNLGNFAAGKIKASIAQQASELFLEDTKQKANDFSNIINQTSNKVNSLNNQMLLILKQLDDYEVGQQDINNFCGKFKKENKNGVLGLVDSNNDYLYGYDLIPLSMQKKIYFLSSIIPVVTQKIVKDNPYYAAVWICFYYDLLLIESEKTISESLYKNNEEFKDFLIKAREKIEKEHRNKIDIFELYKDITQRMIITIAYNNIINGRVIEASGLDVMIDELTNNIVSRTVPVFPKDMKSMMEFNTGLCSFVIDSKDSRIIAFPQNLSNMIGLKEENFNRYNYFQFFNAKMSDSKIPEVKKLAAALEKNHTGKLEITLDGIEYIIAYCRTAVKDWAFGVIVPLKDLLSAVQAANKKVQETITEFEIKFIFIVLFFLIGSISVAIIFLKYALLSPISRLQHNVDLLGSGNFNISIPEKGCNEIVELAKAFNMLGRELKRYTENLQAGVIERHQKENELLSSKYNIKLTKEMIDRKKNELELAKTIAVLHKTELDAERDHAIAEVTSLVAHDVRKPFTYLKTLLPLLPKLTAQETEECAQELDVTVRKVDAMLSDLMETSREKAYELTPENILSVLDLAIKDVSRCYPEKKVDFFYQLETVPLVNLDEQRMCRAFENIISNAFDFFPNDGGFMWFFVKTKKNLTAPVPRLRNHPALAGGEPETTKTLLPGHRSSQSVVGLGEEEYSRKCEREVVRNAVDYRPQTTDHRLRATDYEPQTTECRPRETIFPKHQIPNPESLTSISEAVADVNIVEIVIGNSHSHIPEDKIKSIFESKFTFGKKGGTGLGLSIVNKVIKGHKGSIFARNVAAAPEFVCNQTTPGRQITDHRPQTGDYRPQTTECRPGETIFPKHQIPNPESLIPTLEPQITGVEFVITLPLTDKPGYELKDPVLKNSEEARPVVGMTYKSSPLAGSSLIYQLTEQLKALPQKPNLLILDDENIYRMRVRDIIKNLGEVDNLLNIYDAANYNEAIEIINHIKIDYIICDIDLGKKKHTGFSFLKELMKNKSTACRVLMHTNRKEPKDIKQAKAFGACGFCPKPITEAILVDLLLNKDLWQEILESGLGVRESGEAVNVFLTTPALRSNAVPPPGRLRETSPWPYPRDVSGRRAGLLDRPTTLRELRWPRRGVNTERLTVNAASDLTKNHEQSTNNCINAIPNSCVLLVNDDRMALKMNTMIAKVSLNPKDKISIYTAKNYNDALTLINMVLIDILISDLNLNSKETGVDVCRYLKQRNPEALCIISSNATKNELTKLKEENENYIDEVFSTTLTFNQQLVVVFELLRQKRKNQSKIVKSYDPDLAFNELTHYTISMLFSEMDMIIEKIKTSEELLKDRKKLMIELAPTIEKIISMERRLDLLIDYINQAKPIDTKQNIDVVKINQLLAYDPNNPNNIKSRPTGEVSKKYYRFLLFIRHDIMGYIVMVKNYFVDIENFAQNKLDYLPEMTNMNVKRALAVHQGIKLLKIKLDESNSKIDINELISLTRGYINKLEDR